MNSLLVFNSKSSTFAEDVQPSMSEPTCLCAYKLEVLIMQIVNKVNRIIVLGAPIIFRFNTFKYRHVG